MLFLNMVCLTVTLAYLLLENGACVSLSANRVDEDEEALRPVGEAVEQMAVHCVDPHLSKSVWHGVPKGVVTWP
jgi:hypothetical protein